MASSPALPARFVALDIRANLVMIGAVDAHRHVAITPRQLALFVSSDTVRAGNMLIQAFAQMPLCHKKL